MTSIPAARFLDLDRRPRFVGFTLPALLAMRETLERRLATNLHALNVAIEAGDASVTEREEEWQADHEQYFDLCNDIAMATPRDAAADEMPAAGDAR